MQRYIHSHTHEYVCVLQATRLFLNEHPLYLGPLLYLVRPELGAFWHCLGRCFSLQFSPMCTTDKCTTAVLQDYFNY